MKVSLKLVALLVLVAICMPSSANAQILLQEDFTHLQDWDGEGGYETDGSKPYIPLHWVGEDVRGKAPHPINTPNPNPNYPGYAPLGAPPATLPAVYHTKNITLPEGSFEIVGNHPFPDPQYAPIGEALKMSSGGDSNSIAFVPYMYTLQPNDVLRFTVRVNSHTAVSPDNPGASQSWNNFAFGFVDTANPEFFGFGNPIIMKDNQIEHFAPAGNVIAPFAGETVYNDPNNGHFGAFGAWHEVTLQYSAAKAGQFSTENAYQFFIDGVEIPLPIAGSGSSKNQALEKIGGIGFGNYQSHGANTRFISDWKLELVQDEEPEPIEGDLDGDGFVGQSDLNLILGNWGQDVPPGDPLADYDGSGSVGQGDLNAVLSAWGQGVQPEVAAVPEPASVLLMGLAGFGIIGYGVRQRRVAK